MPDSSANSDHLRILVYSDNVQTREEVMRALGKQLHPDLPELSYVEVATGPMVIRTMDEVASTWPSWTEKRRRPEAWESQNSSKTS